MTSASEPPLQFQCPNCHTRQEAPRASAGTQRNCPHCHSRFTVPQPPSRTAGSGDSTDDEEYLILPNEEFEAPAPAKPVVYIPVICRVCGTRMYGTDAQVGETIKCPDCYAANQVPPPSQPKPKKSSPVIELGEDFEVDAAIESPSVETLGLGHIFTSPPPLSDDEERPRRPPRKVEPLGKEGPPAEPRPTKPRKKTKRRAKALTDYFFTGVFEYPFQPYILPMELVLTIGLFLLSVMIPIIDYLSGLQFIAAFAVVLAVPTSVGLAIWLVFAGSFMMHVLQAAALGDDRLEDSSDRQWLDHVLETGFVVCGLFYGAAPGLIFGKAVGALAGIEYVYAATAPLTAFVLFPFLLLSSLEASSPVLPFSEKIWKSLSVAWQGWLLFYAESAAVTAITLVTAAFISLFFFCIGWLMLPVLSPLVVIFAVLYFRLLGRLAWYVSDEMARYDERPSNE